MQVYNIILILRVKNDIVQFEEIIKVENGS